MNAWMEKLRNNPRLIASAVLPAGLLIALVVATGNPFSSGSTNGPASTGPGPAVSTVAPARGAVRGKVSEKTTHLGGHLWQFLYTVQDAGSTPIAGFQINGPRANLFGITVPPGWGIFGSGVCGGAYSDMLVFWSTGNASQTLLNAKQSATFSFKVRTTGTAPRLYSLSWGQATPQFGRVLGPAGSNEPVSGKCKP